MPNCPHEHEAVSALVEHDVCLATGLCRRCGASRHAIASGARAAFCEPGVTGISWVRAMERMREQMSAFEQAFGPLLGVPFRGHVNCRCVTTPDPSRALTGRTADQIIVDDPPPSAA